jgi:tripartite-type tricarboxylate transporter receptor subunit TctC
VDNRPGAQGIIGVQLASKAPPDGYTLLMFTASHAIHASFYKNLPYDMLKDFAPVSLTSLTVNLLLVNPGVPANSVKELIALAKARPGQLSFGSAGLGSQNHLAMELFKYMTATNMVHIPYKATQSAVIDVLTGRIDLMVGPLPAFMPHIKSGRARALAVSSPKRALALPDLPTVAESGVPGYETTNSTGVPAGTSPDIISKLNAEIVKVLNQPEMKERLISNGAEPVGSSPEEFGEYLRRETAKWANLIKDIGLVPEQW